MSVRISKKVIKPLLDTISLGSEFILLDSVKSTNDYAKENVQRHGAVVIAEEQTGGRGRLNRQWLSPKGKGLWMSVVLRPDEAIESIQLITLASGLAVVRALEQTINYQKLSLKWPNDVFLNGKKVCGVLVESQVRGDTFSRIIIGIGLNVDQTDEDFPGELRYPATSLFMETGEHHDRNVLAAAILNELDPLVESLFAGDGLSMIDSWKSYCDQIDKPVEVEADGGTIIGIFRDVVDSGAVLVEFKDGSTTEIAVGEISPVT